jgi:outer membrane lipoprotein SlyB
MKKLFIILQIMVLFSGIMIVCSSCATPLQQVTKTNTGRVDMTNVTDMVKFDKDCEHCYRIAAEFRERDIQEAGKRALIGAVFGAGLGGAIGGIIDGHNTAGKAAGVGAIAGAVEGAASGTDRADTVYKNCMENRGYKLYW